jgi:hypothetical protein
LQTARKAAKGHKETLRFPGRGDRGAPLRFHGWDTYSNVAAKEHNPRQQSKHTCVLYRGERGMLPRLSAVLPQFGDVLVLADRAAPDMEIAMVHCCSRIARKRDSHGIAITMSRAARTWCAPS